MRLFIAVDLPEVVKDRLAELCAGLQGAKWVTRDQMHLTLRFLGEVATVQAEEAAEALAEIRAPAFELSLVGIGYFGTGRRIRALWAGIEPSPPLMVLQGKVEHAVRTAGLPLEGRKFLPHVTLARFKGRSPKLEEHLGLHEPFRAGPFPVENFVLYSSHLGSEAAIHSVKARYPLAVTA
jgi:2'-5' RNA ligase